MDIQHFTISDSDGGVIYAPYVDPHGAVGFKAFHRDGRVQYILLNPSVGSDLPDDPTVFLYVGPHGDVSRDGAAHHYDMFASD
jgi:hypothetical protein